MNSCSQLTDDSQIRSLLLSRLDSDNSCAENTLVVEELGLCQGESRIDVAVINGLLHGYEIKSDRDSLVRLPKQIAFYNSCLEQISIVVGTRHLFAVSKLVPVWWGIIEAKSEERGRLEFLPHRKADQNPTLDVYSAVKLLWKDETIPLLESKGYIKGIKSKRRAELWRLLVEAFDDNSDLMASIRDTLRSRPRWKTGRLQS